MVKEMRKSKITAVLQAPLEKEATLLTEIVAWLQNKKTQGSIDSATITTEEIGVPQTITV